MHSYAALREAHEAQGRCCRRTSDVQLRAGPPHVRENVFQCLLDAALPETHKAQDRIGRRYSAVPPRTGPQLGLDNVFQRTYTLRCLRPIHPCHLSRSLLYPMRFVDVSIIGLSGDWPEAYVRRPATLTLLTCPECGVVSPSLLLRMTEGVLVLPCPVHSSSDQGAPLYPIGMLCCRAAALPPPQRTARRH